MVNCCPCALKDLQRTSAAQHSGYSPTSAGIHLPGVGTQGNPPHSAAWTQPHRDLHGGFSAVSTTSSGSCAPQPLRISCQMCLGRLQPPLSPRAAVGPCAIPSTHISLPSSSSQPPPQSLYARLTEAGMSIAHS